jgi:nitroimidazol reductase NimA-like FMN-containing flavoprotein (pyridoxamine 5'-phosphate oxidase superfamily)
MEELSGKSNTSKEKIEKILQKETMGFLGLSMNGIPYVVPLSYVYNNGRILFHCALRGGLKLDYIRANPQVCFTVGRQYGKLMRHPQGASCKASHDSVICFGKACIIEDIDERCKILNTFNLALQPDARKILKKEVAGCHAIEITISRMTGRLQRKGLIHTYLEYIFN